MRWDEAGVEGGSKLLPSPSLSTDHQILHHTLLHGEDIGLKDIDKSFIEQKVE